MHRFQGGAAQDVMVRNRGAIEAEEPQRLDDHDHPGDDGGGAVGMQSAHRAPLRPRAGRRGAARIAGSWRGTPRDRGRRRRSNTPDPGLSHRARSPCPPRRWPREPPRERSAAPPARTIERTSAASASSSAEVGGSVARWRSVWRTTPACVETWKLTSSPLPTTSSVDPPPTSMTTVGVVSPGARSLVAPRKVRRASSSPGITRAWRASSCARTRARNASPLAASRTALVSTATARSAPPASMTARYSASVASTRSIAASSRTPVRSRRSPSRVTFVRRSSSISAPVARDLGDEQARGVRADVDDGDSHVRACARHAGCTG